jgi:hypothetical protein
MPSGVVGMFAASTTIRQPFLASVAASLPFSSFCVAAGMARSQATFQMLPSSTKVAARRRSA